MAKVKDKRASVRIIERMKTIFFTVVLVSVGWLCIACLRWIDLTDTFIGREVHPLTSNNSQKYRPEAAIRLNKIENRILRGKTPRILIWVMTTPTNLPAKALAVKETWGKRCDVLIFFSSQTDKAFPAVGLQVPEGRRHLTAKTMGAFRYLYDYHFTDADWFMKADDDTFVIVENLKRFLADKNPHKPIFYGHLLRHENVEQGYYSGGSGYVISKEALRRFGARAINSTVCPEDGNDEDEDFGICMERLGVKTSPTVDEDGHVLFYPLHLTDWFSGSLSSWIKTSSISISGKDTNVSEDVISFHYVKPDEMRMIYFFLYIVRQRISVSVQCLRQLQAHRKMLQKTTLVALLFKFSMSMTLIKLLLILHFLMVDQRTSCQTVLNVFFLNL